MTDVPWYVYLLECGNDTIYTGMTVDPKTRWQTHVRGRGAKYTRAFPPQRMLALYRCPERQAAARLEYRIKQLDAPAKRRLIEANDALEAEIVAEICPSIRRWSLSRFDS